MAVTQTDTQNTDLQEILLALRLEDFDLGSVLEAVEEMILDAGDPGDDGFVARGHADVEIGGGSEIRVKFALWGEGEEPLDEDDYLTLDVTPVFRGQNSTDYTLIVVTPPSVAHDLVWQKVLKAELLDAIHGKARRELAFLGLADDTGL